MAAEDIEDPIGRTMRTRHGRGLLTAITVSAAVFAGRAQAGMPAPLPTDFDTVSRLTDTARHRVEAISFFAAGLLVAAVAIRLLWGVVRRDFPRLPPMRLTTAFAAVVLWGLAFVIVLTMISGARELMTPGAWQKRGFTYKLADPAPPAVETGPSTDEHARTIADQEPAREWPAPAEAPR